MSDFPTTIDGNDTLPSATDLDPVTSPDLATVQNNQNSAIIAVETKLGTIASVPNTSGQVLTSQGGGGSQWANLPTIPVNGGGTGAVTATAARAALSAAQSGSNSDITALTGLTTPLAVSEGGTGVTSMAALAQAVGALLYPVGALFSSTSSTNPGTSLGFGTWSAYAAGRVMVGAGTSDQTFTAGTTGGESNHTLSSTEMPSHTHGIGWNNGGGFLPANSTNISSVNVYGTNDYSWSDRSQNGYVNLGLIQNTGGGGAHNNLQPYVVVYVWQRTA